MPLHVTMTFLTCRPPAHVRWRHTVGSTWSVQSVDKIVNKTCHSKSFFGAIRTAAPSPFEKCSAVVNASDPCWIRGFYEAVLGPEASRSYNWKIGGLPLEDIIRFWEAPFESDDPEKGGCPALPVPPVSSGIGQDSREFAGITGGPKLSPRQQRWQDFSKRWYKGTLATDPTVENVD